MHSVMPPAPGSSAASASLLSPCPTCEFLLPLGTDSLWTKTVCPLWWGLYPKWDVPSELSQKIKETIEIISSLRERLVLCPPSYLQCQPGAGIYLLGEGGNKVPYKGLGT